MPIPSQPTTAISLGPTSGPSSRSISQEFSPVAPGTGIPLGAYRRGDRVADHPVNSTLPAPGQSISFSQFNGKSVVLRYPLNTQNVNAFSYANSPSRTGTTRSQGYIDNGRYLANQPGYGVEFAVPAPSVVGSATRTQDAFVTGANSPTAWNPTTAILIRNQGHIVGAGGGGGGGGGSSPPYSGQAGQGGGNAIVAQRAIFINNQNTIGGGGGGGGGAGTSVETSTELGVTITVVSGGGGGGGGAGQTGGAGGPGTAPSFSSPIPGSPGSLQTGGAGGTPDYGTYGGAGANLGGGPTTQPGQSGQPNGFPPSPVGGVGGAGGAPGFYAKGNSNITWLTNGTRLGQVQPTV